MGYSHFLVYQNYSDPYIALGFVAAVGWEIQYPDWTDCIYLRQKKVQVCQKNFVVLDH
ncbi:hypothetical protein OENI_780035 [Oenococcus oeni]|nr:hypothetical protein OENI_780035 [Oenococcus oeni]